VRERGAESREPRAAGKRKRDRKCENGKHNRVHRVHRVQEITSSKTWFARERKRERERERERERAHMRSRQVQRQKEPYQSCKLILSGKTTGSELRVDNRFVYKNLERTGFRSSGRILLNDNYSEVDTVGKQEHRECDKGMPTTGVGNRRDRKREKERKRTAREKEGEKKHAPLYSANSFLM
jgi:hypothetical protein